MDISWRQIAKFHGNILSLIENIAKSFRECYFFDSHCMEQMKVDRG